MFARDMADSEGGVDPDGEEVLQDGGEQDRVAEIEEWVGAAFVTSAAEVVRFSDFVGVDAPEEACGLSFPRFRTAFRKECEFFETMISGS